MSNIALSNFGDPGVNGYYDQLGFHDGFPYYEKTTKDYIIIYRLENGGFSFSPAYWIEKVSKANGSIPIFTPKYRNIGNSIFSGTWTSIGDSTSGENAVGTVDEISSSSSSSSEGFSSSSQSESSQSESSQSESSQSISSSSSESGGANPCDPDPGILMRVTGSTTTTIGGVTWTLPAESGVEKTICPSTFTRKQQFSNGYNKWNAGTASFNSTFLQFYALATGFGGKGRLIWIGNGPGPLTGSFANKDQQYTSSFGSFSVPRYIGVMPVGTFGRPPTYSDYIITDSHFGTGSYSVGGDIYTGQWTGHNGNTYSFKRGGGWPGPVTP